MNKLNTLSKNTDSPARADKAAIISNRDGILEWLSGDLFFSTLSETMRNKLLENIGYKTFSSGELIVEEGSCDRDVFFLLNGTARIVNFMPNGRFVSFAEVLPGDFFGELSAIDGLARSASVVSASDVGVGVLDGGEFMNIVYSCQLCTARLMARMASIVRDGNSRIVEASVVSPSCRVFLELLRLGEPDNGIDERLIITPVPTQESIAGRAGVTRETVNRLMKKLEELKLIVRSDNAVIIPDKSRYIQEAIAQ